MINLRQNDHMINFKESGGQGTSAFYGHNNTEITELRTAINTALSNTISGITESLHDGIIVPMGRTWYAPEAQEFFGKFKEAVHTTGQNIETAFENFRSNIEKLGQYWAENTGSEAPVLAALDAISLDIDISEILDKKTNGDVGIDADEATVVADGLLGVQEDIKTKLTEYAESLDASTSFLGGDQAGAISELFTEVQNAVAKLFDYLTEGENNLKSQISAASTKYQEIATNVTVSAKGANGSTDSMAGGRQTM